MKTRCGILIIVAVFLCAAWPVRINGSTEYSLDLEKAKDWYTNSGGTLIHDLFISDVDGDGVQEIITVGDDGGVPGSSQYAQLRIWTWNAGNLVLEKSQNWSYGVTTSARNVFCADVDLDGTMEILTGGIASNGTKDQAQLRIWTWNGITLTLKKSHEWLSPGVNYNYITHVRSFDVDDDGTQEIITAGYLHPGDWAYIHLETWTWDGITLSPDMTAPIWRDTGDASCDGFGLYDADLDGTEEIFTCGNGGYWLSSYQPQLQIWNGNTLALENYTGWSEPGPPSKSLQSVDVNDVDEDGNPEIVGGVSGHDGVRFVGRYFVWNWNGTTLVNEKTDSWFLEGDTYVHALITGKVDDDPTPAIIIGGRAYDGARDNAQIRILRWDGDDFPRLLSHEWYTTGNSAVNSIRSEDVDGDGVIEIISGGYFQDAIRFNAQLRIWHLTPPTGTPEYPHLSRLNSVAVNHSTGSSMGSSWCDFNNDMDADLFVATDNSEADIFFRNIGSDLEKIGVVPITSVLKSSTGGAWGDIENDGLADLFVSEIDSLGRIYHQTSPGVYTDLAVLEGTGNSFSSSWADYNNDGYLDLFVAVRGGENRLYRNQGDGTFERILAGPVVTGAGQNMMGTWCDYDLDGDEDLFVARTAGENNLLFQNQGDGIFVQVTTGSIVNNGGESWSASWGDYDNDGWPDLYVANNAEANNLYRNNQDGTFTKITSGDLVTEIQHSRSSGWADIDNDGDLDLFVSNKDEENRWYMNMGGGVFRRYTTGLSNARGASFADYNLDGDMDLFICNDGEPDQLWRNDNSEINNFLQVKCIGTESNRMGIGTKVRVKSVIKGEPVWQTREITNHTGFGGGSEMIAHFGLREGTIADSVRIEWPGGVVLDTTAVDANQRLVIKERTTSPHINHQPAAVNDTSIVLEGQSVVIDVHSNDSDVDGDELTITSIDTTETAGTAAIDPGDTTLTFTPAGGYTGQTGFNYVISDGNGGLDTATVSISVEPVTSVEKLSIKPEAYALYQNHPNPFNPTTEICYYLPKDGDVRLVVFDVTGKQIESIVDQKQSAGSYRVIWNASDSNGHPVPSGVYFYRIEAGEYIKVRKMLLVR